MVIKIGVSECFSNTCSLGFSWIKGHYTAYSLLLLPVVLLPVPVVISANDVTGIYGVFGHVLGK